MIVTNNVIDKSKMDCDVRISNHYCLIIIDHLIKRSSPPRKLPSILILTHQFEKECGLHFSGVAAGRNCIDSNNRVIP